MSSLTTTLYQDLCVDLQDHLDPYQLDSMSAGKPMWPGITAQQAQCYALGLSLFKKYNDESSPSKTACKAALEKFLRINERSAHYVTEYRDSLDEELMGSLKANLWDFWNRNNHSLIEDLTYVVSRGSLGAGANIGARGTDFYTKVFDSRLSCTKVDLLYTWEKTISNDPRWSAALHRGHYFGSHRIVEGSKLSFVNKNVDIARVTCTEPTINMWMQLGVGDILESRLREVYNVSLASQPDVNRELAKIGSIDGSLSTIDLESASDTLSMGLLGAILPPAMYQLLSLIRSPIVTLPDGRKLALNMMGTMGNGTTFPLQTIVFCCVVKTVYQRLGIKLRAHGPAHLRNFGVFGDDIIVTTEATRMTIRLLELMGCIPNVHKTFVDGPFRESCGHDWFSGHFCRGVYIKTLLSKQDYCVAINRLNQWSAITGVALRNVVSRLHDGLRSKGKVLFVPPDEQIDAGLHVPFNMARGHKTGQHGIRGYVAYTPIPSSLKICDDGVFGVKGQEQRHHNPNGLWLVFLRGSIRGQYDRTGLQQWSYRMGLRQISVRYTTKRRITTMWDSLPLQHPLVRVEWSRWLSAVEANFSV